jgi:hypothetical protein
MDMFGETKMAIGWTVHHTITEGERFAEKGVGFKYNQFLDSHSWVRSTDPANMRLKYAIIAVVYQDGTMEGGGEEAPRNSILVPQLLDKRFASQDYQEFIWFDIRWDTTRLKKPTRAVKGVLHVVDLFGDPQLSINLTIDDPLQADRPYTQEGTGFKYNQFMESHKWVRATAQENMRLVFVPSAVIYADGTREEQ